MLKGDCITHQLAVHMYKLSERPQTNLMHLILRRNLSGATPMQLMGHQVVGSVDKSHEDVKLMYEKFFGGQAVNIKAALKEEFTSIKTRKLLTQIFKVVHFS